MLTVDDAFIHVLSDRAQLLADLTDEQLVGMTQPVTEPGYPEPNSFPVRRCLGAILNEEWQHRLYAERDLGALERQSD